MFCESGTFCFAVYILGAMEPLTAVVIGVFVFNELFTLNTFIGILLILVAVSIVVGSMNKSEG